MTKRLNDATPDEWDEVSRKWEVKQSKTDGEEYREARKRQKIVRGTMYKPEDYNKQYNNVHSPAHYNQGQTECIDAIEAMLSQEEYIGYLRGNSMKYRWRFRYKNGFEDLNKAEWYEKRLVKFMEDHNVLGQKR
ncbi:uncharacterized protein METZ01_LOCUS208887 [marine metagenome]|uniref:Uncharacterized protein n=1 Tax=marine metagenome TaxID=408172 RepID=A0A382F1F0_9ZZZZ